MLTWQKVPKKKHKHKCRQSKKTIKIFKKREASGGKVMTTEKDKRLEETSLQIIHTLFEKNMT